MQKCEDLHFFVHGTIDNDVWRSQYYELSCARDSSFSSHKGMSAKILNGSFDSVGDFTSRSRAFLMNEFACALKVPKRGL
jgi:hypothetical protein